MTVTMLATPAPVIQARCLLLIGVPGRRSSRTEWSGGNNGNQTIENRGLKSPLFSLTRRTTRCRTVLAVDFTAMSNLENLDGYDLIINICKQTIITHPITPHTFEVAR